LLSKTRRTFLRRCGAAFAGSLLGGLIVQPPSGGITQEQNVEAWMQAWIQAEKRPLGALHISRFVEPIYFLTKPITWEPNPGQDTFKPVIVPIGFVTDFASIPRIFWSLLRPDGEYTYPAIIHDFLYWTQDRPRDVCDEIFKLGMEEFGIHATTVFSIYNAVRLGGDSSWNENARLKASGERRVLKRFPDDPLTRWEDWKRKTDVFI
jgi:Protein of unknown function (DUF1353)